MKRSRIAAYKFQYKSLTTNINCSRQPGQAPTLNGIHVRWGAERRPRKTSGTEGNMCMSFIKE